MNAGKICVLSGCWFLAAAVITLFVLYTDDDISPLPTSEWKTVARSSQLLRASSLCFFDLPYGGWPLADLSANAQSKCQDESTKLLGAKAVEFTDERAFVRTIDLLFTLEGRERTPYGDARRPIRIVTAGANWDSALGRYPSLGRGFQADDKLVYIEGNPITAQAMRRRTTTELWGPDARVVIHAAVPWLEDAGNVTVKYVRGAKDGSPVTVDLAAKGAMPAEHEGTVVPSARIDSLLPPSPVGDTAQDMVDLLMVGDAGGQEPQVLAGAKLLVRRARAILFVCQPRLWPEESWRSTLTMLADAGHTVVLLGLARNIVLTPVGAAPDMKKIEGRAFCLAVQTGNKERLLSQDAGFILELLLAGRRAVLRSDSWDAQRAGVHDSACLPLLAARITEGCGKVVTPAEAAVGPVSAAAAGAVS